MRLRLNGLGLLIPETLALLAGRTKASVPTLASIAPEENHCGRDVHRRPGGCRYVGLHILRLTLALLAGRTKASVPTLRRCGLGLRGMRFLDPRESGLLRRF